MIKFESPQLEQEFFEAFGFKVSDMTIQQLWWIIKFAKHVRGRCRSNRAMNHYLSRCFKAFHFTEIIKTAHDGSEYKGLSIEKLP